MTPGPADVLIVHTGAPSVPGCVTGISPAEYGLLQGFPPGTYLLTQMVGMPVMLLGLTSSAVAAAWAALYSSWGSVLKMAAVRPPAREDCETLELALKATPNSMIPNVRSTSSGRIMANSTIAAPRSSRLRTSRVAPAARPAVFVLIDSHPIPHKPVEYTHISVQLNTGPYELLRESRLSLGVSHPSYQGRYFYPLWFPGASVCSAPAWSCLSGRHCEPSPWYYAESYRKSRSSRGRDHGDGSGAL